MLFSKEFGRIKIFIPKAYTKKGGVVCFVPGLLDFAKKNSDLSRFYSFDNYTDFYHYLNNHEIIIRLHLVFEILDGLIEPELADATMFELLLKYNDENFRRLTPYLIYFILKKKQDLCMTSHPASTAAVKIICIPQMIEGFIATHVQISWG